MLAVVNGIGQAGLHALIALAAIAAVQTAGRFRPAFRFGITQFDFLEIAFALLSGKFGHLCPGGDGFVFRNGPINRIFANNRFAAFSHIAFLNIPQNRFRRFFAGTDGPNGHPGTGLQIASGKHSIALRRIGYRIDFRRSPAGIGQPGNSFQRR